MRAVKLPDRDGARGGACKRTMAAMPLLLPLACRRALARLQVARRNASNEMRALLLHPLHLLLLLLLLPQRRLVAPPPLLR